ncbi:MAG: SAM-dependent chlorinase/fluorinase, partial [Actinobacteria bacterium]|nr:SAM-dependent chlorinase/fluorinase [Actinomycetota bacterium]
MSERPIVSFLSDYGLEDEFVGVCHGVILKIAPEVLVIDVHHNILRQQIRHGAVVLQQSIRYLPDSVHLAVVDPSVGSGRRALILETGDGQTFVGPDNGLLLPAARDCGGVGNAYEISNEDLLLTPVSRTFQGRDVFAPTAAHLATGVAASEFGPEVDLEDLVELEVLEAWAHEDHLHAAVLQVDRFGNLQLNLKKEHLDQVGLGDVERLEVRAEGHRIEVCYGATFSDVAPEQFVMVEDSYGQLSLAVNNGDAAARLRAGADSTTIVGPP